MKKKKAKSAIDFLNELNADPVHVAQRSAEEDARVLREAEIRTMIQPLREELETAGYPVASLDALLTTYAPLPKSVVSLLLKWLVLSHDTAVQEQIVRALAASGVAFEGEPLVTLFESTDSSALRYAIANTIAQSRVRGIGPWVLEAVQNPEYGIARQMLALAVARLNPKSLANPVLVRLLDQIPAHAALGLAEAGGQSELEVLERVYADASGWVRQEIGRAISVIRRRLAESV